MSVARKQIIKSQNTRSARPVRQPRVRATRASAKRAPVIRVRPPSLWEAITVWWAWLDGYSFFSALFRREYSLPREGLIKCVPAQRGSKSRFFLFFGQRPVNGLIVDQIPKSVKAQVYSPESPFFPKLPRPQEMVKIYFPKAVATYYLLSLALIEVFVWAALNQAGASSASHAQWGTRAFYLWTLVYPFIHYRIFSSRLEFVFFRKLLRVEGFFIQGLCLLDLLTR